MRGGACYSGVDISGVHQSRREQKPFRECGAGSVYPEVGDKVVLQTVGASHALVEQVAGYHEVYPVRLQPGFAQDVPDRALLEQGFRLLPGIRARLVVLDHLVEFAAVGTFVLRLANYRRVGYHGRFAEAHCFSFTVFHADTSLCKQTDDVVNNAVHHRSAYAVNDDRSCDNEHLSAQAQHEALAFEVQRR